MSEKKFIDLDEDGYEVGKGKPPKATRFEKGKSGNPSGRKRKSDYQNWEDPVFDVLFEPVTVRIKGKRVTMPSIVLMLRALRNNAIKGCYRSFKILIEANNDPAVKGLWGMLKKKGELTEEDKEESRELLKRIMGEA